MISTMVNLTSVYSLATLRKTACSDVLSTSCWTQKKSPWWLLQGYQDMTALFSLAVLLGLQWKFTLPNVLNPFYCRRMDHLLLSKAAVGHEIKSEDGSMQKWWECVEIFGVCTVAFYSNASLLISITFLSSPGEHSFGLVHCCYLWCNFHGRISPDKILSGWLGSKLQLTSKNNLRDRLS